MRAAEISDLLVPSLHRTSSHPSCLYDSSPFLLFFVFLADRNIILVTPPFSHRRTWPLYKSSSHRSICVFTRPYRVHRTYSTPCTIPRMCGLLWLVSASLVDNRARTSGIRTYGKTRQTNGSRRLISRVFSHDIDHTNHMIQYVHRHMMLA